MKGGNGYETFQKGISDAGGFVHVGWMRDDSTGSKTDQIQESIVQRISIFMIGVERIQIILYMLQVHKKQRL